MAQPSHNPRSSLAVRAARSARGALRLELTPPGSGPGEVHPPREVRRSFWRCAGVVLLVAMLARVPITLSIPLWLWSDSQLYLKAALGILEGGALENYSTYQTPGYPLLLAGIFGLFGTNPTAIVVVQHGLGCLTAVCLAAVAYRYAGPRWAVLVGVLFGLDPLYWIFETWAMTETLAVFMLAVTLSAALLLRGNVVVAGLVFGLLCGGAFLARPNLHVALPLLALAWIGGASRRWRGRALAGVAMAVGFAALAAPWLNYNRARGVSATGVAQLSFWAGTVWTGLLDPHYPLPEELREKAAPFVGRGPLDPGETWRFGVAMNAQYDPRVWPLLGDWAWASVRRNPGGYLRALTYTLSWHLNIYPRTGIAQKNEITDQFLKQTPRGGRSLGETLWHPHAGMFLTESHGGVFRNFLHWYANAWPEGLPQVPLFAATLTALVLAACRRDFVLATALLGVLAIVLLNVVMLRSENRYSLPGWAGLYVGLAIAGAAATRLVRTETPGRVGTGSAVTPPATAAGLPEPRPAWHTRSNESG